jgi:hypothetical protein
MNDLGLDIMMLDNFEEVVELTMEVTDDGKWVGDGDEVGLLF